MGWGKVWRKLSEQKKENSKNVAHVNSNAKNKEEKGLR